jgi:hypothetical protein
MSGVLKFGSVLDRSGVDSALSLLEPVLRTRYFDPGAC